MHNSKTTDDPTFNKRIARADAPYCITRVQNQTLTIKESGVLNAISIDWATPAIFENANVIIYKKRNATNGEKVNVMNEHQVHEGVVAKSLQCENYDRHRHTAPSTN